MASAAATSVFDGGTFYFCSAECLQNLCPTGSLTSAPAQRISLRADRV